MRRTRRLTTVALLSIFLSAAASSACVDPVHDDAVDALGPEAPGVRRGPQHRPGQPCLTCHGGNGPGEPEMSIGGTVFDVRGSTTGIGGATVVITDAKGTTRSLVTNNAGNFYILKTNWDPVFPVHVEVSAGEATKKKMETRIGRDGSCATCHVGTGDNSNMPGVFLRDK